jgi:chorismate synthase
MTPRDGSHTAAGRRDLELRRLASQEDYDAAVALQRETWGDQFAELVPATMMQIVQKVGGVAAGAFAEGRLLGFVFGITGVKDDRRVHWSDMLAVRPEARDAGVGRRLKHFQRELLLPLGVETMYWSFDPLVARNAFLNLERLGARVDEYVVDMYGTATGSPVHEAVGTDRFVVGWDLAEPRPARTPPAIDDIAWRATPVVSAAGAPLPEARALRIEIPGDIHAIIAADPARAAAWRTTTRRAFVHYLANGWRVVGVERGAGAARYRLARG